MTRGGTEIEDAPTATLTMQVYGRLRQDIIDGVLAPGLRLKIAELCKTYEVGSSPIREALNLLTSFGLVHRHEQRGFQVPPIVFEEFDDLLNVRCWIEERALRESIARGDDVWEERVTLALFRLTRAGKKTVPAHASDWEAHHRQFHTALLSACGSPKLLEYCAQLYDQNIRYRRGSLVRPVRHSNEEHSTLAKAVLDRQADLAVSLLCTHYVKTGAFLKDALLKRGTE
jgi:GntR family carbon starvation induced transcriptional regulator